MRSNLFYLITACIILSTLAVAKEPRNLANFKHDLVEYHDSGNYMHDINNTIKHALSYLQLRLEQKNNSAKLAVVLDIDETSLSNYTDMLKMDFGGAPQEVRNAEDEADDPAIVPTLQLYRYAKSHGLSVFFITGRFEYERQATIKNLTNAGYNNWDGLFLRSKDYEKVPAEVYKTDMRKQLTAQGYKIILNIGDQKSDLIGGYADKTFKLSNPYYFIP